MISKKALKLILEVIKYGISALIGFLGGSTLM